MFIKHSLLIVNYDYLNKLEKEQNERKIVTRFSRLLDLTVQYTFDPLCCIHVTTLCVSDPSLICFMYIA